MFPDTMLRKLCFHKNSHQLFAPSRISALGFVSLGLWEFQWKAFDMTIVRKVSSRGADQRTSNQSLENLVQMIFRGMNLMGMKWKHFKKSHLFANSKWLQNSKWFMKKFSTILVSFQFSFEPQQQRESPRATRWYQICEGAKASMEKCSKPCVAGPLTCLHS